jgi:hypothetical protein
MVDGGISLQALITWGALPTNLSSKTITFARTQVTTQSLKHIRTNTSVLSLHPHAHANEYVPYTRKRAPYTRKRR